MPIECHLLTSEIENMKNLKEPDFFSTQVQKAKRFYIEGAKNNNSRLKVVCGGCEHTALNFMINRSDFPYYSIEFIARGRGTVVLKEKTYHLMPGTIFSYGPNVRQKITANENETMIKYFVDFTGLNAKQMLKKCRVGIGSAIQINQLDEIIDILDKLIDHGISDSPYKSMLCTALLEYLLYRISELMITKDTENIQGIATYQKCRKYIRKNFRELNSLRDIAESCCIDHAYICRLFKRFDSQSPYQYLTQLKMAFAAEYLHKPGTLVKDISYKLGFADPFHFSRTFKKVFGTSPQSFKNFR